MNEPESNEPLKRSLAKLQETDGEAGSEEQIAHKIGNK